MHCKSSSFGAPLWLRLGAFSQGCRCLCGLVIVIAGLISSIRADADTTSCAHLQLDNSGDHELHILTPNLLELYRVNAKQPNPAHVDSWDWVNAEGTFVAPDISSVKVLVNGQQNSVTGIGFKRRPQFAP